MHTQKAPLEELTCFGMFMNISSKSSFLHLHEIVDGLYSYFSMSVSVCVCLSVCMSVCEQNADRTTTLILTQSSLNSCLLQSLEPY